VTLPILIECDLQEADGFIFQRSYSGENDNIFLPVRVLPLAVLKSVEKSKPWGEIQTRYGIVSERTRAWLVTANVLMQAIQTADSNRLDKYVMFKATEETREEASEEARENDLSEYGLADLLYKEAVKRLEPKVKQHVLARVQSPGHPIAELCAELYRRASSQLVLWWRQKERNLAAGIYCSSLDAALSALLLSRMAMPQGTAICARCQKPFIRVRIAQKFCSSRCGNAVRQADRREKQKENKRDAPLVETATHP
jgi:transposase-like protein